MGTPLFALPALEVLATDPDFEVQAAVTQEDKKTGRKQLLTFTPVKEAAMKLDIPVLQPPSLKKNADAIALLKGLKPDFVVTVAFGQILSGDVLEIPRYGCVNLHGSLLPKYRGASPVEEALLHGDAETGITFIKMDEKLDSGDILLVQRLHIEQGDNALTLRAKLSALGARLLPYLLKDIKDGLIRPIPQNPAKATYCRKIRKEDGLIDLSKLSAQEIINRIRAYTPWPGCYLIQNGKRLKILEAGYDETSAEALNARPGQILIAAGKLTLGTRKGLLIPHLVQIEGKKAMPVQDFLRGNANFFK